MPSPVLCLHFIAYSAPNGEVVSLLFLVQYSRKLKISAWKPNAQVTEQVRGFESGPESRPRCSVSVSFHQGNLSLKQCWPHRDMFLHFEPLLLHSLHLNQVQTIGAILSFCSLGLTLQTFQACVPGIKTPGPQMRS